MKSKLILFAILCSGVVSCSTFSGPQYNVQTDDNKKNGGMPGSNPDNKEYKEDVSSLYFKINGLSIEGTAPQRVVTKKSITLDSTDVTFFYVFPYSGKNMIMQMHFPNYKGVANYGFDQIYPVTFSFHEYKPDEKEPTYDMIWTSDASFKASIVYEDEKYVIAKFSGNVIGVSNTGGSNDEIFISDGNIKGQFKRN